MGNSILNPFACDDPGITSNTNHNDGDSDALEANDQIFSPPSPWRPHRTDNTIKEKLRTELFNWPRNEELISSYIRSLCRNCSDGKCNGIKQSCEDKHHSDIERAIYTFEKVETIYFLNNIQSMPDSQFSIDSLDAFDGSTDDLDPHNEYKMLLHYNLKEAGYEKQLYKARLKLGYHRKDQASKFAPKRNPIVHAIKAVTTFDGLVISIVLDYLDDACDFCGCHLGINFIPNHPEQLLSCYACKALAKSVITEETALRKYYNLTVDHLDQLTWQNKSEIVGNVVSLFFVKDVEDILGHLQFEKGNDSDYYESDEHPHSNTHSQHYYESDDSLDAW